jgi:hypothetical protein
MKKVWKKKNPLTKKIQLLEESESMNPYVKIHTLGIAEIFMISKKTAFGSRFEMFFEKAKIAKIFQETKLKSTSLY